MLKNKISVSQAVSIILSIFFAHSIMSLPKTILTETKSGTFINLIYISVISIALVTLILKLMSKFKGKDILDISSYLAGNLFKNIIGAIFICYFIFSSSILLRNFSECLKLVYFPMTDIFFIVLLFIITLAISGKSNVNNISKISLLIAPLVLLSVFLIFSANLKNFYVSNFYPLLGDGHSSIFIEGLKNLCAFGGITTIYFLPKYLKEPDKFKKVVSIAMPIAIIYLFICIGSILFIFDYTVESNQLMPLYSAARHIEFGTFFQRLESAFLLIWILQMVTYLSISLLLSLDIFKNMTKIRSKKPLVHIFCILIFTIAMLPDNYAVSNFLEQKIYGYTVIFLSLILSPCILLLAAIKSESQKIKTNRKEDINA